MAAKLGLIAGLGDLPVSIAKQAVDEGRGVYVLRIAGFVEPGLDEFEGETVGIGEIGKQVKLLKSAGCEELVFAGIVKRPDFSNLKLDMRGTLLLPKVLAAARRGDDALLRVLVQTFEKEGFQIRGADDVNKRLIAPSGLIAGPELTLEIEVDLKRAAYIANIIGAEDIGQGCVVHDGLVLAVEAQEGTDGMLKRVAALPGRDAGGGVLVKRPKPIQERRIDLPTIGADTVQAAYEARLSAIGVEAGGALILDLEKCKQIAEARNISLFGFSPAWGHK